MEIVDGVHFIECPYPPPINFTSVVAIMDESITLIDAAMPESPDVAIFPYLRRIGRDPDEISTVILTHGHGDHIGGIPRIKEVSDASVHVHRLDRPLVEDVWYLVRAFRERFPDVYGEESTPLVDLPPLQVDCILGDGDVIDSGRPLKIIHTPGHSDGSICILVEDAKLLVSGDSIQGYGESFPLVCGSIREYRQSIHKIRELVLEDKIEVWALGHPYLPFKKGVLKEMETSNYLEESLKATEDIEQMVFKLLEDATSPLRITEINTQLPKIPPLTIGCILEHFLSYGRAQRECGGLSWSLLR